MWSSLRLRQTDRREPDCQVPRRRKCPFSNSWPKPLHSHPVIRSNVQVNRWLRWESVSFQREDLYFWNSVLVDEANISRKQTTPQPLQGTIDADCCSSPWSFQLYFWVPGHPPNCHPLHKMLSKRARLQLAVAHCQLGVNLPNCFS